MRLSTFSYIQPALMQPDGRIVLIGMATDGPVQRPFILKTGTAVAQLGENELARSYDALLYAGVPRENLLVYRLNGRHSKLRLVQGGTETLTVQSIGASDEDNELFVEVRASDIFVFSNYKETSTKTNFNRRYRFSDYPYIGQLADAINEDAALGLCDVVAREVFDGETVNLLTEPGIYSLSGGSNEATLCASESTDWVAYESKYWPYFYRGVLGADYTGESVTPLMNVPSEILLFTDLPAEVSPDIVSFAGRIAEQKTQEQSVLCTSLFHVSPLPEEKSLRPGEYMVSANTYFDIAEQTILDFEPKAEQEAFIEKLRTLFNEEDRNWSYMQYVQIVVGETGQEDTNVFGSVPYAALYALSDFRDSLANQTLPGVNLLRKPLSKSVVATLQANGYICIVPSIRKKYVIPYAQSVAYPYAKRVGNFTNRRLMQAIGRTLRDKMDSFIGQPINYFPATTASKIVEDYLKPFVEEGILSSYSVSVPTDYQSISGAYISVVLGVYDEVREVAVRLSVREQKWEVDLWNPTD